MNTGEKIKSLRLIKKMTLTELSEKSFVQLATLSRIENNKMTGTIQSHKAIAKALDCDVSELYRNIDLEKGAVIETVEIKGISDLFVKDFSNKKMKPQFFCLHVGAETHEAINTPKEKLIYILNGKIEIVTNDKKFLLKKENIFHSSHYTGSSIRNVGPSKARFLSIEC